MFTRLAFRSLCRTLCLTAIFAVGGCASTHNLKTDGMNVFGGGFTDEELRPGLYRMTASSNRSLWANFTAARETWRMRADMLCGADAYRSFEITSHDTSEAVPTAVLHSVFAEKASRFVDESVLPANHVSTINGYVLCNSTGMTVAEATDWIRKRQADAERRRVDAQMAELVQLGGESCNEMEHTASAESYFRRGKILLGLERYAEARSCFLAAQKIEPNTRYSGEACSSLGLMYELGLGVSKDTHEAMRWYRKAGL